MKILHKTIKDHGIFGTIVRTIIVVFPCGLTFRLNPLFQNPSLFIVVAVMSYL